MTFKRRQGVLIFLLLAALVACTSKEEKSLKKFEEARQVELAGQTQQAEELFRKILVKYPGTPGAGKAKDRLEKIRIARELALLKASQPILNDFRKVMEGYRSMYGAFPLTLQDLDGSDYFFDSDYLAESVPVGFDVFLALGAEAGGYRIWVLPQGAAVGFLVDATGSGVRKVERGEIMKETERSQMEQVRKGRVAFLSSKTPKG